MQRQGRYRPPQRWSYCHMQGLMVNESTMLLIYNASQHAFIVTLLLAEVGGCHAQISLDIACEVGPEERIEHVGNLRRTTVKVVVQTFEISSIVYRFIRWPNGRSHSCKSEKDILL